MALANPVEPSRSARSNGAVDMTLPANRQGGQRLRLLGQGMSRPGGGNGDLYVKLTMVVPPLLERLAMRGVPFPPGG
jgi:DnaJ-class molecular chaperone